MTHITLDDFRNESFVELFVKRCDLVINALLRIDDQYASYDINDMTTEAGSFLREKKLTTPSGIELVFCTEFVDDFIIIDNIHHRLSEVQFAFGSEKSVRDIHNFDQTIDPYLFDELLK